MQEVRCKLKLYGCKVKMAVRPNGIALVFSVHYPGSTSYHVFNNTKAVKESKVTKITKMSTLYPRSTLIIGTFWQTRGTKELPKCCMLSLRIESYPRGTCER